MLNDWLSAEFYLYIVWTYAPFVLWSYSGKYLPKLFSSLGAILSKTTLTFLFAEIKWLSTAGGIILLDDEAYPLLAVSSVFNYSPFWIFAFIIDKSINPGLLLFFKSS